MRDSQAEIELLVPTSMSKVLPELPLPVLVAIILRHVVLAARPLTVAYVEREFGAGRPAGGLCALRPTCADIFDNGRVAFELVLESLQETRCRGTCRMAGPALPPQGLPQQTFCVEAGILNVGGQLMERDF